MKRDVYVGAATLPPISKETLIAMDAAFPPPVVEPGADRDKLMYEAGARKAYEWLVHKASSGVSVSGDPRDLKPDVITEHRARVRLGS